MLDHTLGLGLLLFFMALVAVGLGILLVFAILATIFVDF